MIGSGGKSLGPLRDSYHGSNDGFGTFTGIIFRQGSLRSSYVNVIILVKSVKV